MKTPTRSRILEIIERLGSRRPAELAQDLRITPQAVHRHLKSLLSDGALESRGRGPLTRYALAGVPQLAGAEDWYRSQSEPAGAPGETACETRDVFAARQARMAELARSGVPEDELALVIAVAGEIGNNCFDHNLGHWRDIPGCWFETQLTGALLWICIADRGQGVFRSLSRAHPGIADERSALVAAFEKKISGRAPESRGNGLKFVRSVVTAGDKRGLACRSGGALAAYGALGSRCARHLSRWTPNAGGTATLLAWRLA